MVLVYRVVCSVCKGINLDWYVFIFLYVYQQWVEVVGVYFGFSNEVRRDYWLNDYIRCVNLSNGFNNFFFIVVEYKGGNKCQ